MSLSDLSSEPDNFIVQEEGRGPKVPAVPEVVDERELQKNLDSMALEHHLNAAHQENLHLYKVIDTLSLRLAQAEKAASTCSSAAANLHNPRHTPLETPENFFYGCLVLMVLVLMALFATNGRLAPQEPALAEREDEKRTV